MMTKDLTVDSFMTQKALLSSRINYEKILLLAVLNILIE